ncbi:MAG: sulfur carrier protein ThiS [Bacteroidetes bacterium]|nr:sulfur carrier protein ThiS [Bacteroidota bacterium]MBL7105009.1 sulfur carrier protein ThiS [Bacteroidales bacterium]
MKITLNNRKETIDADILTVQELIEKKNFTFRLLVTKVNGKLVKRDERDNVKIKDGDNVAVIHLISGG